MCVYCVYVFVQYICSPSCQDVFSLDNTVASEVVLLKIIRRLKTTPLPCIGPSSKYNLYYNLLLNLLQIKFGQQPVKMFCL